jgi:hypothetical protein
MEVSMLTLLVIRHGEKPGEAWPGPGLTSDGQPNDKSLVIRGWQRTGAWTALFGAGFGGTEYPTPDAIYAANPAGSASRRPYETITALAARLGITPNMTYAQDQEEGLVKELLGLSGVVLVSWEHKMIVEGILPRLPISSGTPPTHWNSARYDVVLRLDRPDGATGFAFRELFPMLLSGDSDEPLH